VASRYYDVTSFRNVVDHLEASSCPGNGFVMNRLMRRRETNGSHTRTILFRHVGGKEMYIPSQFSALIWTIALWPVTPLNVDHHT
jgi:hypothetical protein